MSARVECELAGVRFQPSNIADIVADVERSLIETPQRPLTIGFVNPHVITTARSNADVVEYLAGCDHVCVDGTGVWLALRLWTRGIRRLPAYQAADRLLYGGVLRGATVVVGIEPDALDAAIDHLASSCPDVEIVGSLHGFSSDGELAQLLDAARPSIVLVGAGSPRSEKLATVARARCPQAIIFHVGAGTLKVYANTRRHAPRALSVLGLDWLYRFVTEPHTRDRYRSGIPAFIRMVRTGPNSLGTRAPGVAQ